MRVGRLIPTLLVLAPLALPAGASADDFQRIWGDYRADGQLNGCYRPEELHNAGSQIPPDIEQYAPGFGNALSTAQSRCSAAPAPQEGTAEEGEQAAAPVSAGTPGAAAPPDVTKKAVREPPAPKAVAPPAVGNLPDPTLDTASAVVRSETPGALIALLVAAGVAVAFALAWTIAWLMGWSPERLTKPLFAAFQTVWDRLIPGR